LARFGMMERLILENGKMDFLMGKGSLLLARRFMKEILEREEK